MKTEKTTTRICPKCGKQYSEYPAISRTDNRTEICPDCGTREALASFGCSEADQEHILRLIRERSQDD